MAFGDWTASQSLAGWRIEKAVVSGVDRTAGGGYSL
jgi:hypothetical protein